MAGVVVVNQPPVTLYDSSGNEIAPAKEATLATRASEVTLEAARVLLVALEGKDYATQTTLATRASEATLEAARVLLVSLDGKDFATETTQVALGVILSAIETKVATETTLATRASEATLASIKDTAGVKKITDELPAGTQEIGKVAQGTKGAGSNGWPVVLYDGAGNPVTITNDAGVYRVEITGKVQTVGAIPPPATTPVRINADTPLTVRSHDTSFVIPTGETFYMQAVTAGNEDPTKGAVIEVLYDNGTEHLVERIYTNGETIQIGFPDLSSARDGTVLVGNGSHTIVVRRTKYSGSNIAVDAGVQGYTV